MIIFDLNAAFRRFFHDSGFENFQFAKARHAEFVTPKIRVISSSESLFNKISWVIILRFLQEALGDWLTQLCLITFYYMIGLRLEWTLRCRNDIFWSRGRHSGGPTRLDFFHPGSGWARFVPAWHISKVSSRSRPDRGRVSPIYPDVYRKISNNPKIWFLTSLIFKFFLEVIPWNYLN